MRSTLLSQVRHLSCPKALKNRQYHSLLTSTFAQKKATFSSASSAAKSSSPSSSPSSSSPSPAAPAAEKQDNLTGTPAGLSKDGKEQFNQGPSVVPCTDGVSLFEEIGRAYHRIRTPNPGAKDGDQDPIIKTSCKRSYFLSELCGMDIWLKNEFSQFTGSFKERGARNSIMCLVQDDPETAKRGVIAASAGNHALAMAWHGKQLGVPVTVVMPTVAPLAKVDKCRRFGANIILHGSHIGDAKAHAEVIMKKEGLAYINGYDDLHIIAGAGTMGLEILEQCPKADAIVIPVGGAGLIAGVAAAAKTLKPDCKVYGVEPRLAASFTHAVKEGKACVAPITPTLADGLSVPQVGSRAFEVARPLLDDTVIVEERDIALALLRLVENEKMIVEGAGATGLAACLPGGPLHNHPDLKGKTVVVPLCGGNIDTTVLGRVFDRGLAADDRLVRFVVTISDRPGGVAGLTRKLADLGVSIKDIFHERAWLHTSVDKVQIKCIIETTGKQHSEKVKASLESEGYPLEWGIKANEGKIIGSMDV